MCSLVKITNISLFCGTFPLAKANLDVMTMQSQDQQNLELKKDSTMLERMTVYKTAIPIISSIVELEKPISCGVFLVCRKKTT